MWWAGKRASARTAIAYAGERAVRLSLGGALLVAADVDGRESALAALSAGIRDLPRGTSLRVTVSGAVCRPFLLPEVAGVAGEGVAGKSEWTAIAAALVEDRVGLPAGSPVWLDGGQSSPKMAVAIDAAWRDALVALDGRSLKSVRPWWALAIESTLEGRAVSTSVSTVAAGLAVADSDELVLLIAEGDTYRVAQTYPLDGESATVVLNRALVTHDLPSGGIELIEFDTGALPGQQVDAVLPFRKGVPA
ncbi:hypothetical protein PV762_06785 [Mitsuaria sp. CC2]|uniref:hypothetical protein n=1 Tax=Mitsuaria sp. CC2 TaxID=3029186 RepID=UPI003B8DC250